MSRADRGIMWVTFGHLRPAGYIMPDHAGDRGAAFMALAPHDHLAYQADECVSKVSPRSRRRQCELGLRMSCPRRWSCRQFLSAGLATRGPVLRYWRRRGVDAGRARA